MSNYKKTKTKEKIEESNGTFRAQKYITAKTQNSKVELKSRMQWTKERNSELKDKTTEITQSKE